MNTEELQKAVTEEHWNTLKKTSDKLVATALKFELKDRWGKDRYFRPDLSDFKSTHQDIYTHFHEQSIGLAPEDIIYPMFQVGIYVAVDRDWAKYKQLGATNALSPDVIHSNKSESHDVLLNMKLLERLRSTQEIYAFIVPLWNYQNYTDGIEDFEASLQSHLPKEIQIVLTDTSSERVKKIFEGTPFEQQINFANAIEFLSCPSIVFVGKGSPHLIYQKSCTSLRILCDLLRIAGFLNPGQISSDVDGMKIYTASMKTPGSVGTTFNWDEEGQHIAERRPDGNLYQSHGHRQVGKMYIDSRNYGSFVSLVEEWNEWIVSAVENPYNTKLVKTLVPILHLLSEVTQAQSVGSKVLLLNCCLENMFVPAGTSRGQKRYIVGALKAIDEDLLEWFYELYQARCTFAHEGYLLVDDDSRNLVTTSIRNVLKCLSVKLR